MGIKNEEFDADFESVEKRKTFYTCVLEFHFTSISGMGGSILSKEVKIVVPYCSYSVLIRIVHR
jgi:hypothetical protein